MRIQGNQTGRLKERSETEKKREGGKTKEKRRSHDKKLPAEATRTPEDNGDRE